ncbi:MAG: DUF779 domain-containing protein [bacterium]|jgi:uncharacterized protein (DUF779 family)
MDLRFTDKARALLAEIREENAPDTLVILIGGGCCENTAPILMKNFRVGASDRPLGESGGVTVYASADMYPLLAEVPSVIDVIDGRGAGSFSLEVRRGVRLTLRPLPDSPGSRSPA